MSSRDDVLTPEDELESVTVEDETPTAPAPDEPADPADPEARADSTDAETEPAGAVSPEIVPYAPPDGGEPFRFKADGREFDVEGALRYEHGIYVPTKSWDHIQRHLGDWDAHRQRYQALERQYQARDPEKSPEVIQARETLRAFQENILGKTPEEVAAWLDNFEYNKALLQAQIRERTLQAQLDARNTEWSEQEHETHAQTLAGQLPGYLKQSIDYAVQSSPDFKELVGQGEDLFQKAWPMREWLFVEAADKDRPDVGLEKGQIGVHPERLKTWLKGQADGRAEIKRLEAAATLNKKAVAPATTARTVTTRGRPAPGDRSKSYKSYSEFKDQFMSEDLLQD